MSRVSVDAIREMARRLSEFADTTCYCAANMLCNIAAEREQDSNAVPDLLEALRPMAEGTFWLTEAHVKAAAAAIAKATGGAP